jgi:phage shock protein A
MGILARLRAIFLARVNEATEALEDPRSSLNYSLHRLEDNQRAINNSLVEVLAAKKNMHAQRSQLEGNLNRLDDQALTAVQAGRDDLARKALERKQDLMLRLPDLERNIELLEVQVDYLRQGQVELERKTNQLRMKKEELQSMYQASQAQLRVREALSGISADLADVGTTIQRIEERIQAMRSRTEAIDYLVAQGALPDILNTGDDIDRQLLEVNRTQRIEEELARMKSHPQLLPDNER